MNLWTTVVHKSLKNDSNYVKYYKLLISNCAIITNNDVLITKLSMGSVTAY